MTPQEELSILKRGIVEIISEEELLAKLKKGKPLRVKAGFDPTSPDLHLGHTVLLQKMKQFQDLGHEVIFIIGDYTAMIGDPSGRNETRPPLSTEQIRHNVKTYEDQVFKILDQAKTKAVYNSEWLGKMVATDLIRLAAKKTVSRMLERDDFEKRYKSDLPISLHEFLYPLLQGQDSVEVKADVELGGTDQKFNLLVGRDLQRDAKQEPQVVMTLPLLVGTDGVQKMSKSYGNAIGIAESPEEMFGKIMSVSDNLMWNYYELLSQKPLSEIQKLREEVRAGTFHPKEAKKNLAVEIVARFHNSSVAENAAQEFEKIFSKKELPSNISQTKIETGDSLVNILSQCGGFKSKSHIRQLIGQGAVRVNNQKVTDIHYRLELPGEYLVQAGARWFNKIILKNTP
ncbi:MAG: tyrosine--tRNA ligase [Deltaproteobacteria bacterium]|nr:tyrosine--tRNA ligase [Deltaproteobacteria bacterium]